MSVEQRLQVRFEREAGNEPVREWLKTLPPEEKKIIGDDLKNGRTIMRGRLKAHDCSTL